MKHQLKLPILIFFSAILGLAADANANAQSLNTEIDACVAKIVSGNSGRITDTQDISNIPVNDFPAELSARSEKQCSFSLTPSISEVLKNGKLNIALYEEISKDFLDWDTAMRSSYPNLDERQKDFLNAMTDRLERFQAINPKNVSELFLLDMKKFRALRRGIADDTVTALSPIQPINLEFDVGNVTNCRTQICQRDLTYYIGQSIWQTFSRKLSKPALETALKNVEKARENYEKYLFETGDGMYAWELWANSVVFKPRSVLEPPTKKLHLLHPATIVYYNKQEGELMPSAMLEVLGVSNVDYKNDWKNIGGSFALDLNSDRLRYGGVVHLPLKAALGEVPVLKEVSEFIPCNICSVGFFTDGDDDWSVGVKLNAAGLFFAPGKIREKYGNYLTP